jgi:uncharacterized glyoxalase superfamily metalloenzyme YdcJ
MTARADHLSSDAIRTLFSTAMSRMYQAEVPQYGALVALVAEVNAATRAADPGLDRRLLESGEAERLDLERHGAVRVGTASELSMLRRLFAVMGMQAVGYYDLSVAGVPVHSTAFRPVDDGALRRNPFRVFASLLRLEMIEDTDLRQEAADILERRSIFTPGCLAMIDVAEREGGLTSEVAQRFVTEALETFRWHSEATVTAETYERLHAAHPLIADVVCFKGPHINHLTPRTLDIDTAQAQMRERGLNAKAVIEGPPPRQAPILLRQTSFQALKEPVTFCGPDAQPVVGAHRARFGEIEQRGAALTPAGRALYDRLLVETRAEGKVACDGRSAESYLHALSRTFEAFPDSEEALRRAGLAYFRYTAVGGQVEAGSDDLEAQIACGAVKADPITYEDFLPVSAAGIFRSNLGGDNQEDFAENANQAAFEAALGEAVLDPFTLYARAEADSRIATQTTLSLVESYGRVLAGT